MLRATPLVPTRPLRVALLNWRDSGHPEGGGSELYVEQVAAGLAARGHDVVLLTARYPGSAAEEVRDGYRVLRAGGRFSVYPRALLRLLRGRLGDLDVVVDVQNGMPFLSRLVTSVPVVVLCHHVHREQWPIVMGPVTARVGWAVESRLAPRLYRGSRYVTVSEQSRTDLVALGVRADDVDVVHNGTPAPLPGTARSVTPEVLVLGRVVPHKRVEHAVRAVAALRAELPDLTLTVVGSGWWQEQLREEVVRAGLEDAVRLVGHVDETTKHGLLARAWVCATPSVKEGWGLCAVEAAAHGTPTVAYRSAGGLAESVLDGRTGLLCDDGEEAFTAALRRLLVDDDLRERTGLAARAHAARFTWDATVDAFAGVLAEVTGTAATLDGQPALDLPYPREEQPLPVRAPAAVQR